MDSADGRAIHWAFTARADGDFDIDGDLGELQQRRCAIAPGSWTWLRQEHGREVVLVDRPGDHAGAVADASVTASPGATLAIQTADCVPILFQDGQAGVIGAAHGGWRGLDEGVVSATVEAMVALGADRRRIAVVVGPHISPAAYEFSAADLTRLALRFGPDVASATAVGTPALDLGAATRAAVSEAGIDPARIIVDGRCTATAVDKGAPMFFSWRARQDSGRQTSVIWIGDAATLDDAATLGDAATLDGLVP